MVLNPTRNTRHIETRRSIASISKIVKSTAKQRQARINAERKDLKTTETRNKEQFQNKNNKKLLNNLDDNNLIDSSSLYVDSQEILQTIFRLFFINNASKQY